jgi:hypothetical protein
VIESVIAMRGEKKFKVKDRVGEDDGEAEVKAYYERMN